MPRRLLTRSDFIPYHVTARGNNRENFPVGLRRMWEILTDSALLTTLLYSTEIHAFVLMPNHFHMLITTPEVDLGKVMDHFMSTVTKSVNLSSGRSGRIFGGPYYWSLIGSGLYYAHAYKYVYRNPVKAGLSETVESYPWSTLYGLLGYTHLPFPIFIPKCGHGLRLSQLDTTTKLEWLNRPFPKEAEDAIKRGLTKRLFDQTKDPNTRRRYEILNAPL